VDDIMQRINAAHADPSVLAPRTLFDVPYQ
jgi:hypothetical protein